MFGTKGASTASEHSMALGSGDYRDLKTKRRKTAKFLIYEYIY